MEGKQPEEGKAPSGDIINSALTTIIQWFKDLPTVIKVPLASFMIIVVIGMFAQIPIGQLITNNFQWRLDYATAEADEQRKLLAAEKLATQKEREIIRQSELSERADLVSTLRGLMVEYKQRAEESEKLLREYMLANTGLNGTIAKIDELVRTAIPKHEARLDDLERRMSRVEGRLGVTEKRAGELEKWRFQQQPDVPARKE